jgi:hypothetical protein
MNSGPETKALFDAFARGEELAKLVGGWVTASLETQAFWPQKARAVQYNGFEFLLLPAEISAGKTKENPLGVDKPPGIALHTVRSRLSAEAARVEIMRFASALAWQQGAKIQIVNWSGGSRPLRIGRARNVAVSDRIDGEGLQIPKTPEARTALAFYREGLSLDNPFYAFLSSYKAFSVAVPKSERAAWIARKAAMQNDLARRRREELEQDGVDVAGYLYEQCRHAIAHADREPFVDPDSNDDHYRLVRDGPLMAALARVAIEERFGVRTPQSLYREHLYQLEGFRELLAPGALRTMKNAEGIPVPAIAKWPRQWMAVARCGEKVEIIRDLQLLQATWLSGSVRLRLGSPDGCLEITAALDFAGEQLLFEPLANLYSRHNREDRGAIAAELSHERFVYLMMCNGRFEVWDQDRDVQLGRTEGYLPINLMVNPEGFRKREAELEALLASSPESEQQREPPQE